jgi:NAD(P)-dependent dehydrogenase (short-subunit alcohol dehydrogenase family)
LPQDVAGLDDVASLVAARGTRVGIDVLINNAAIPKRRAVTDLDPFDAESVCGWTSSRRCT